MEKTIYDLKLHESMELDSDYFHIVFRVPGGWIYRTFGSSAIFVPFHGEFDPKYYKRGEDIEIEINSK